MPRRLFSRSSFTIVLYLLVLFSIPFTAAAQGNYFIIYLNDAGEVVALNPVSGGQHTLLTIGNPLENAAGFHVSPNGDYLAVFVRSIDPNPRFHLYVVTIPEGSLLLDHNLLPPDYTYPPEVLGDPAYELTRALGEVRWSPSSRHLAFTSGQASTADILIFEPSTQSLVTAENGAQTAALITWNRAGTSLVYSELASFGDGSGYQLAGMYVYSLVDASLRPITPPASATAGTAAVGWLDDERLLYAALDFTLFGARGVYLLDLNTLNSSELLPPHAATTVPVFDTATQTLAFAVPDVGEVGLVPGAYLWRATDNLPTLLQSGAFYTVELVRNGLFQFEDPNGSYLVDASRFTADEPPPLSSLPPNDFGAFVSPSADAVALLRVDGLYISRLSSDDAALVWAEETQIPIWSPDGSAFYSFGFTGEGAGLVEINVINRTLRLLDTRMAVQSPRAVAPPR